MNYKKSARSLATDLYQQPGHLIRRAHQIINAIFVQEMPGDITPLQFAILRLLQDHVGIDQVTLAQLAALDTSTAASVTARLAANGLLRRTIQPTDRRQWRVQLTAEGYRRLDGMVEAVQRVRERTMAPLNRKEQKQFIHLLNKLVGVSAHPGPIGLRYPHRLSSKEQGIVNRQDV